MELSLPLKLLWNFVRVAYVVVTNFVAIPAYITWYHLLFPLKKINPAIFWKIEAIMFKGLLSFVSLWLYSGGYTVMESGDNISEIIDKKSILLVNHQSTGDVPIVMTSMYPKGLILGNMTWIMDFIFKFSNFGWVSWCHGDFFLLQMSNYSVHGLIVDKQRTVFSKYFIVSIVKICWWKFIISEVCWMYVEQGKEHKDTQLKNLENHLRNVFLTSCHKWIVLFPEGGFLRKRRKRSQEFAKKNNFPVLQNVALPRLGALKTLVDTLNSSPASNGPAGGIKKSDDKVQWIIDMTLAYPQGEAVDLLGMIVGWWSPRVFSVHYRVYSVNDIPYSDSEQFTHWLYDRFQEKNDLLGDLYTNKKTLDESDTKTRYLPRMKRRLVDLGAVGHLFYHVFYAVSTYIFCYYLYLPFIWTTCWVCRFVF